MSVGTFVLHQGALEHLADSGGAQWDDPTADFAWVLVDNAQTPATTENTYSDISANECADGDYSAQAVGSRATNSVGDDTFYTSSTADFGAAVTISGRYLYLVQGDPTALLPGDVIIGHQDLNDGGSSNVSSGSGKFQITQPTGGWFKGTI